MYSYENDLLKQGLKYICGVDEVGRGPLAGPLVAAAVILDPNNPIEGLNDSKKLSAKKRSELLIEIKDKALAYAFEFIEPKVIDEINVYQASKLAMINSINQLNIKPDYVLSDAMPLNIEIPCLSIIKGDTLSASIAAASIVAKEVRDEYMINIDKNYPGYNFKQHKGYPTKEHIKALNTLGVTEIHRLSYKPVKEALNVQISLWE